MSDTKKQNFLHGTALLAISAALVKVIGAFYSIPLKRIIGDDGYTVIDEGRRHLLSDLICTDKNCNL